MATIEGRGVVPPAPIAVKLSTAGVGVLAAEAERRASFRSYNVRSDRWGRGFIGDLGGVSKTAAPILVGLIGEWAFAEFVNSRIGKRVCETDVALRESGDGGVDFEIFGVVHQVKTRRKKSGANFVRRVSERGRIQTAEAERYVFAQWNGKDSNCQLLGWVDIARLRQCRFEKSPVAGHFNAVVPERSLLSMGRLIDDIRSDATEGMAWR